MPNTAEIQEPIIIVTGANRGIGYEVCRQLAKRKARVILTARSAEAGEAAVAKLAEEDLVAEFLPLDITDDDSVEALRSELADKYERLDVLINNAGVLTDDDKSGLAVKLEIVRQTFETNTLGPMRLTQALAPLLRRSAGGRVINISSGMGALSTMGSDHAAYRISKAALNAVSGILAAELRGKIAVNSMCPGWVKTDMGGSEAEREVSQGADTAVWLALDAPRGLTGKFLRDRQVISW
jgi:NAD(P)-dependent dehydrogenase (short-subunit alcohol dehydrogenase family)